MTERSGGVLLVRGMIRYMETYLPTMTVAGVLAFLAPLIATALYRLTATPQVKQLIAIGVAVVLAAIALLVTGGFTPPDPEQPPYVYWLFILFQIIAVAQIAYALVWKNSTVNDKIALVTSSETERQKFIAANTIEGEVVPEGKEAVPDIIVENTPVVHVDRVPGPDHREGN